MLFNGRPLTLSKVAATSPAILEAWFPGIEAGNAVADVLFGKVNPGGKLPVTFPRTIGQVPIYYNHEPTGRPCDVTSKYTSRYRDLPNCDPLYPFGFGLSYTTFAVSNLQPEHARASSKNGTVTAIGRREEHRNAARRRRRAALHPRPGREHLAAGPPPARLPARDARAGPEADGDASSSTRATSASTTTAASSSSSRARSTSTPATARPPPLEQSFTVSG